MINIQHRHGVDAMRSFNFHLGFNFNDFDSENDTDFRDKLAYLFG